MVTNFLGRLGLQKHIFLDLFLGHVPCFHRVRDLSFNQRRPDITWADRIHGDALLGHFKRDSFGQAGNAVLGGNVSGFIRGRDEGVRGGCIDDPAPARFLSFPVPPRGCA
jgi:hypothetical protein